MFCVQDNYIDPPFWHSLPLHPKREALFVDFPLHKRACSAFELNLWSLIIQYKQHIKWLLHASCRTWLLLVGVIMFCDGETVFMSRVQTVFVAQTRLRITWCDLGSLIQQSHSSRRRYRFAQTVIAMKSELFINIIQSICNYHLSALSFVSQRANGNK